MIRVTKIVTLRRGHEVKVVMDATGYYIPATFDSPSEGEIETEIVDIMWLDTDREVKPRCIRYMAGELAGVMVSYSDIQKEEYDGD